MEKKKKKRQRDKTSGHMRTGRSSTGKQKHPWTTKNQKKNKNRKKTKNGTGKTANHTLETTTKRKKKLRASGKGGQTKKTTGRE